MSAIDIATEAAVPARHWINAQWTESRTTAQSINPSTGEAVGHYQDGGDDEAAAAITAASAAFETGEWARDVNQRARALSQIADGVEARSYELASMMSQENGMLLWQTMFQVGTAVQWLRYNAAACLISSDVGRHAEIGADVHFRSIPEPLGVAGIITPWNAPITLTVRALGPALAAGCTTVIKMPAQTALTNTLFAEIIAECSAIPAGVVNIFTESGSRGAELMVSSPKAAVISYTGSTPVGRKIVEASAATLKRLNLELGGKTPLILLDDADLDVAIPTVVSAATMFNGQFCVTGSRVLVHRAIADEVRARLSEALAAIQPGRSDDPASQIGPLIDRASAERVDRLVEDALAHAVPLVRGGLITDGPLASGAFYRPTLLEVQRLDIPVVQQELFGPVQTFELFDSDAEAVHRANATEYGLGAAVFTRKPGRAHAIGRGLQTAGVWINTWGLLNEKFEQGGFKASSNGGFLCGPRALEQFQQVKVYGEVAPAPVVSS
ncbi:aldehyde dehydrogenase [Mycolicibacterium peregrinum]|uniref:aldehyde dehydrogenase family protein n=1 Tax=Mycolicibacterium peregrinum TaxID=43304 RepID=UPI0006D79DAE|nr:aldehyde dehydrogenase family protein [Mycolicibacterium peregrinum]MCV7200411.1 aldehyde dehydrogenase family protein [Mycolicibacterium peregrinum]ORW55888.1 aldehyde dehydrogenase [Mycolicibacterium peregrinum]OWL98406.1 aldehyde dehydrogenase [Mycolicibacterium peregrinum]